MGGVDLKDQFLHMNMVERGEKKDHMAPQTFQKAT